jgi:hypothetical protein
MIVRRDKRLHRVRGTTRFVLLCVSVARLYRAATRRPNRRYSQVAANAAAATPDSAPQRTPPDRGGGGSETTPSSFVNAGAET